MSLTETLASIRGQIYRTGVDPVFVFRSYDHLHSGRVPLFRVISILNANKVSIDNSFVDAFLAKYTVRGNEFNYMEFAKDMENMSNFHPKSTAPERIPLGTIKPKGNQSRSYPILQRFQQELAQTRGNIDDFFKIHDKLRHGTVTPQKFATALNCFHFSQDELTILLQDFQLSPTQVDYISVLEILNNKPYEHNNMGATKNMTSTTGHTNAHQSIFNKPVRVQLDSDPVIRKCHHLLAKNSTSIEEGSNYFSDHDPLRKGVVGKNSFLSILVNMYKLALTPQELQILVEFYQIPVQDQTPVSQLPVDYIAFIRDVQVGADMESQKTTKWNPRSENTIQHNIHDTTRILQKLAKKTRDYRIDLTPFFQDFDKDNSHTVNALQFERVLDKTQMKLSADEMQVLHAQYLQGSKGVNYYEFLCDLNAVEQELEFQYTQNVEMKQKTLKSTFY